MDEKTDPLATESIDEGPNDPVNSESVLEEHELVEEDSINPDIELVNNSESNEIHETREENQSVADLNLEEHVSEKENESMPDNRTLEESNTEEPELQSETDLLINNSDSVKIPSMLVNDLVGAESRIELEEGSISSRTRKRTRQPKPDTKNSRICIRFVAARSGDYGKLDDYHESTPPTSYKAAMKSPDAQFWKSAAKEELDSHAKNITWDPKPIHTSDQELLNKTIPTRWVFVKKPDRYKGRLVARGDVQSDNTYSDTFSLTLRFELIRLMLCLAVERNFTIRQLDIRTAFLNSEIDAEIYIFPPEGTSYPRHSDPDKKTILRLKKGLYGLKQAGKLWSDLLFTYLKSIGYTTSPSCPSIFKKLDAQGNFIGLVAIFVDDILVLSKDHRGAETIVEDFQSRFDTREIKSIPEGSEIEGVVRKKRSLLGFEIVETYSGDCLEKIKICKSDYIRELKNLLPIVKYRGTTPMAPNYYFSPDAFTPLELTPEEYKKEVKELQKLIGIIMYIAVTIRADISYAAQYLAKFTRYPHPDIKAKVKHVIAYLFKTPDLGIEFKKSASQPNKFLLYVDSDYSTEPIDRKSQNAYVCMRMGGLISWKSKPTKLTCQSSTEAEYLSLVMGTNETVWLTQAVKFLNGEDKTPPAVYVDNMSAIKLAKNPVFHARTKHFDEKLHVIRDRLKEKQFEVKFINGENQIADLLTKPVDAMVLKRLRPRMLI